jgi:uncharacterized membrane protein
MTLMGSKVPLFKLRPYKGLLLAALFVFIVGGLLSACFFTEEADYVGYRHGLFTLLVTLVLGLLCIMAAFSRYRFRHLRHHRPGYKRG